MLSMITFNNYEKDFIDNKAIKVLKYPNNHMFPNIQISKWCQQQNYSQWYKQQLKNETNAAATDEWKKQI